jgi:hypothetical protein
MARARFYVLRDRLMQRHTDRSGLIRANKTIPGDGLSRLSLESRKSRKRI